MLVAMDRDTDIVRSHATFVSSTLTGHNGMLCATRTFTQVRPSMQVRHCNHAARLTVLDAENQLPQQETVQTQIVQFAIVQFGKRQGKIRISLTANIVNSLQPFGSSSSVRKFSNPRNYTCDSLLQVRNIRYIIYLAYRAYTSLRRWR